jgi:hypothetical protein
LSPFEPRKNSKTTNATKTKPQPTTKQMEEEGVPSTTLREISLLKMLSESNHIVK